MRRFVLLLAAVVASVGVVGTAQAGRLNWEGTGTLVLGDFPEAVFTGGGVATINDSASLGHITTLRLAASRGNVTASFTLPVTDPEAEGNSIAKLTFIDIEFQTGTFTPISGGAGSATTLGAGMDELPVGGIVRFCLINNGCPFTGQLVLDQGASTAIGVGGLLTVTVLGNTISVEGAPWTIKTTTVIDHRTTTVNETQQFFTGVTFSAFAHSAVSGTTNTAGVGGVVQLISPTQVRSNLPTGSNTKIAAGIIYLIRFVPEPGLMLLIGSGVAGLALLGRRKMRR